MKEPMQLKSAGFTLIEVIITLVVAAIVGAMMVAVLGSSMTRSSEPIARMQESFVLQQVMENFMTAYYEDFEYFHMLPELKEAIESGELAGNDPEGDPWQYTLTESKYIKFDLSGNEVVTGEDDPDKMLKITIRNNNNEILTYVFAP